MPDHPNLTGVDLHETKGADAALLGQILIANGSGSAVWSANQVDFVGATTSDSTTQTAPGVGVKKAITLDTNLIIQGVSHTATSSDFTIDTPGIYQLVCIPQFVTGGGGAGSVELSWEVNTGAGFVTIAGSPIINLMAASDQRTTVCQIWANLAIGDIVRSMWATNSASVNIQPVTSLVGDTIPSVQQYATHHGI